MLLKLGAGGVNLTFLHEKMRKVLYCVQSCWPEEPVITSTIDGTHGGGSWHTFGRALDFRLPSNTQVVVSKLKENLGKDYDVVIESDHIHVEYDPKG